MAPNGLEATCEIVCLDRLHDLFESVETCTYMKGLGASDQQDYQCSCKDQPCDEDSCCFNRASQVECAADCPFGEQCQNQRFSRLQYADVSVIYLREKGYGLRANTDLRTEQLILEYVGEIISEEEYNRRKTLYHEEGFEHYYFMFLQKGEYIDARKKGNLSRFFNHSCAPNCHIETWHVMGKLRVGIFAQRDIKAGEELVIDYKTDTRGAEPQKCACRAKNCKGHIGSKQPAKPRRIIRLRVGNKAVEDPPETSVMGDTIEVVHFSSAKSQVSTKRDEPQSPSSP
ncbi:histone methyltransferase set2, partial [Exophiala xenobiotica]